MRRQFEQIKVSKQGKNLFDLSHEKKLSGRMGLLYPVLIEEVIPGDFWRVRTEVMVRLAPMLSPVMHRINLYIHYFWVPMRQLWENWNDFLTGGKTGTSFPTFPKVTIATAQKAYLDYGKLADYMGLPAFQNGSTFTQPLEISELPFRAYQLIYNRWYRDQNLTTEIDVPIGDTVDIAKTMVLRNRSWEKDYFTSALPFLQKGNEVTLPISGVVTTSGTPTYTTISTLAPALTAGTLKMSAGQQLTDVNDVDARILNLVDPQTMTGSISSITTTINE